VSLPFYQCDHWCCRWPPHRRWASSWRTCIVDIANVLDRLCRTAAHGGACFPHGYANPAGRAGRAISLQYT
jgi:hypothetical protein